MAKAPQPHPTKSHQTTAKAPTSQDNPQTPSRLLPAPQLPVERPGEASDVIPDDDLPPPQVHPGAGRPTTYTPEKARAVLHTLRTTSLPIDQACAVNGIGTGTWWDWYHRHPGLSMVYSRTMATRAVADVARKAQQWDRVLDQTEIAPDEPTLRRLDTLGRNLDRASRYSQWVAERHNPAVYASRALVGIAQLGDPASIMAAAYGTRDAPHPQQVVSQAQQPKCRTRTDTS